MAATDRATAHRAYHGQYVTEDIKDLVLKTYSVETLRSAFRYDKHFNSIELVNWDMMGISLNYNHTLKMKLKENGDFITMAGIVCILKEAARQIISQ